MKKKPTFGKIKIKFPVGENGDLGRIEFEHDFCKHKQTVLSAPIIQLFLNGVRYLCDQCRHAKKELQIALEKRGTCPDYRDGRNWCSKKNEPCDMSCALVVESLNEYRKAVNNVRTIHNGEYLSKLREAEVDGKDS